MHYNYFNKVVRMALKLFKNKNKGFTLVEIVVALALLIIMGGFSISTVSSISQARMRESAQTLKSEFELTRNFAKTHGGQATFSIKKVDDGLLISRTGENLTTDETLIRDRDIALFYKETGDDKEYHLGEDDADDVSGGTLQMVFSQTEGAIIGPHMLDYIIISNGSKNFKFIIQQASGMMYYDYEIESDTLDGNEEKTEKTMIKIPYFIKNGMFFDEVSMNFTDKAIQPELFYDSRNVKIGGEYRAKAPGQYEIVFKLKDPYSTMWEDGTTEDKYLYWEIK
jgi:prepilin-type N-terminal cleavage/methylation domain-containing protein